jgi:hypothetical protein
MHTCTWFETPAEYRIWSPHTPSHLLYMHCIYNILIQTGKGGGGRGRIKPERRRDEQQERVQITKLG